MMATAPSIERVAIVGATGRMGGAFSRELAKTGKHTVTALTREWSQGSLPDGVVRKEVDFEDEASLVSALSGQQFLAITLPLTAPKGTHSNIVQAAAKAGVPYIMPNSFGYDIRHEGMVKEDMYSAASVAMCDEIQGAGSSYIAMVCGFWYQWSLALGEPYFGIDIKNKKVTFIDDGKTPLPTSTWDLCGKAFAELLSLPASGAQPSVDQWKNQLLYIASFTVSQRDMLDSIHRILGDSDADWDISYENSKDRYIEGVEAMQSGDRTGFIKAMYTRSLYPKGGGNYTETRKLDNDVLGLQAEDFDQATKEAIEMVRSGWNPFA